MLTTIERQQQRVLAAPLIGRAGDRPLLWTDAPFAFGLSFNR